MEGIRRRFSRQSSRLNVVRTLRVRIVVGSPREPGWVYSSSIKIVTNVVEALPISMN